MASDWERLQIKLKERFDGEMDYDSILFMIGLQELSKPFKKYKKDDVIKGGSSIIISNSVSDRSRILMLLQKAKLLF
jgi:hypothetical protein